MENVKNTSEYHLFYTVRSLRIPCLWLFYRNTRNILDIGQSNIIPHSRRSCVVSSLSPNYLRITGDWKRPVFIWSETHFTYKKEDRMNAFLVLYSFYSFVIRRTFRIKSGRTQTKATSTIQRHSYKEDVHCNMYRVQCMVDISSAFCSLVGIQLLSLLSLNIQTHNFSAELDFHCFAASANCLHSCFCLVCCCDEMIWVTGQWTHVPNQLTFQKFVSSKPYKLLVAFLALFSIK